MDSFSTSDVRAAISSLGVPEGGQLAVAVSGGADSVALLLLAAEGYDVTGLTVNHGLREEATAEAGAVSSLCQDLGIKHEMLVWGGSKPDSNIQAAARAARYTLMADWCKDNGCDYLATAHHQDDQAETILLRLARGSGVYGLAGMAPTYDLSGVTLIRPLLAFPKAALVQYLEGREVEWVEDPSNQSEAYDRVKVRKFLKNPPLEGFKADRLAATAARLRRSRDALEHYEAKWLYNAVEVFDEGYAFLKLDALQDEPEEILLRGLASLCRYIGKGTYVPRMEKLSRLFEQLRKDNFRGQTLYGAQFTPCSGGEVLISRELRDCEGETFLGETCTWDNRFEISVKGDIAGLKICALGEDGWQQMKTLANNALETATPRLAILALPAVFRGSELQAVPHLGYSVLKDQKVDITPKRAILLKK